MPKSKAWYSIQAQTDGTADIYIYDEIGVWGIMAIDFIKELNLLDAKLINLHINSPGGNVFQGNAIFNAIKFHSAEFDAYIEGLAGSISSYIPLAARNVYMAANSHYAIHNPRGRAEGESKEIRKVADNIDVIREQMANAYSAKTGASIEDVQSWMDEETWFTAEQALEVGFIDGITDEIQMAAHFDLSMYTHAPERMQYDDIANDEPEEPEPEEPKSPPQALLDKQIKVKHLDRSLRY